MTMREHDLHFHGSIPEFYETYLVPLIFEPYADDLAARVASHPATRVLEIAAGTGVVTRRLAATLPASVAIVASDLNPPMLAHASSLGTARPVEWRQADAMSLPFDDASFDAVVCQFGVMFLPDKPRAFAEMRRVLRTGGLLAFNTWDRIEDNEFADVVTETLATLYPDDPPQFMRRTPHGYHDRDVIAQDVSAGFAASPDITTVAFRSRATSARIPALAYCQGTVLRNEIEARDPNGLERATALCTDAIAARFGHHNVDGKIQAHVLTTTKR